MKKIALVLLFLVFKSGFSVYSQACNGCTMTLSSIENSPIYVNPGDKLCITADGQLNSTLYISGGEVCNEGIINGVIDMNDGVFTNNWQILSGLNISVDEGTFTNHGIIQAAQISFNGSAITALNSGDIVANNFQMIQQTSDSIITMTNNGTIGISSYLADNTVFTNNGALVVEGQFSNNNAASFYNYGVLDVVANFTNRGYFYTECVVNVGGLWANNLPGVIEGPSADCGGFRANLSTSNFSDFGMDGSNLDMCDTDNVGSFNFNSGNIGPNVTYCSCINNCLSTISIKDQSNSTPLTLFPNPAESYIQILGLVDSKTLNYNYTIYNSVGKRLTSGSIKNSKSKIDIFYLPRGSYLLTIGNSRLKFIK